MKSLKVTWTKDGEIVANSSYLDTQLAAESANAAVSGQVSSDLGNSVDGLESRSVSLSLVRTCVKLKLGREAYYFSYSEG